MDTYIGIMIGIAIGGIAVWLIATALGKARIAETTGKLNAKEDEAKQLLEKCEKIGQTSIVIGRLSAISAEQAREAVDMLKKKAKSAAIVLGLVEDGNATLFAGVTDDLIAKGLKAGDIVKEIAPLIGGGGGGRPQMAQAGGKNPEKIDEALTRAAELIKEKLSSTS